MTEFDPYDRLIESCRNSSQYPYTLLNETTPRAVLEGYHEHLVQNDGALFDDSDPRLVFWEAWPGTQRFKKTKVQDVKGLSEHLIRDGVDPNSRHIFIESNHSRAPLNCSPDMLKTLFTYHQVDPSFLDSLFAFGDQDEPLDAGLAHFRSDDKLNLRERLPRLPRLGRSGMELRHSFLLRSVERADAADPWSIRQVAAYHSFDVENGRSVWITLKGNNLLQKRIKDDSLDLPVHQGALGLDVGAAFEASLATHLTFFHWCEHNWRWYVRDVEERIRTSLARAKTIPVESEPSYRTGVLASSRDSTMQLSTFNPVSEKGSIVQRTICGLRWPDRTAFDHAPAVQEPPFSRARRVPEGLAVLNMFNYKDLQKLSILAERIEEATLVVQLNVDALQDVYEYYQRPIHDNVRPDVRMHMEKSAATFLLKLRQIIRSLETRHTQLASLRKRLDNGKALYENLLQLRSLQVSRVFAEHGHKSAINMENIARRTERETVSMHTVTVVTLLFLPATFLGVSSSLSHSHLSSTRTFRR
ncbi:hypothetical protein C8A01DRAFT_15750 [Parachaetomium inaequale]|uniref:CorA-like transporter domain-containing protein n=1 Tax=Parachaetomium inaequale TaxID=2588326 RepID=A0AAN6SRX8_9PEZI|nr:hypothetical protein C8A01DRAFT_15750 [Parachaetomium inaequale]